MVWCGRTVTNFVEGMSVLGEPGQVTSLSLRFSICKMGKTMFEYEIRWHG